MADSEPPAHSIGVLVLHVPDRRLLTEFLRGSGYRVVDPAPREAHLDQLGDVSLIIADEGAARLLGEKLLAMKSPSGMVLSLVITMPPRAESGPWLRSGFDDVLRMPITKAELASRTSALLRLREQWDRQQKLLLRITSAYEELERRVLERTAELTVTNEALRGEIVQRRRAEQRLSRLSARLLRLRDEEQRRIGRELHDSTSQNLAALAMNLTLVEKAEDQLDANARRALADSLSLIDQCSREIRTISYLLHPPLLDEIGLPAAIHWYATGFAKRSGVRVRIQVSPQLGRLPADMEHALFRTVQESLTNIYRHAGSPTARIRLWRERGVVMLEVIDKGHGMAEPTDGEWDERAGVGIMGMRERMRELGGELQIRSGSKGTTVAVTLPLPPDAGVSTRPPL
jgi:signal transduction histidine kinase